VPGHEGVWPGQSVCPRQDSNLRHRLRRAVLYPLSYGGSATGKRYQVDRVGPRAAFPRAVSWLSDK
jgi:hypothetical protein